MNILEQQLDNSLTSNKRTKVYLTKYFLKSIRKTKRLLEVTYNVKIKKIRSKK